MIEVTLYENDANIGTIEINDSDTFPLSLTKSNSDIRDITKRQGVYTKDFKVLATAKNNRFLKYIYNANATAIGGRDCSVSYNGMPILTGIIFAINIGQRNQADEYTLRIYSDNVDWYTLLGAATINSYDYGNLEVASFDMSNGQLSGILPASTTQSTLSRAYIEASWRFPSLFDYVYPLISYGQTDKGASNGNYVAETDMRPAIYIGKMLTKAFASIGYTLDSDFFSTGIGSKLILPFTGDAFTRNQQFVDANSFKIGGNQSIASNVLFFRNGNFRLINNIEYSDPSNINNTSNGLITIQQPANYVFAAKGRIGINCINQQNDARLGLSTLRVGIFGTSVTQEVTFNGMPANTQIIDIQKGQTIYLDYDITTTPQTIQSGSQLYLYAIIDISGCTDNFNGSAVAFNLNWLGGNDPIAFMTMVPEPTIVENTTFTISDVLKDIRVLDIIGGLQNIFNLYFETNNDARTVTIEPKTALIKPISQGIDLTDKLDVDNRITTDIIQTYNRNLQFQYAKDSNDKWQDNYNQQQGTIFGSANYDLGGEFKDGTTQLGTKFFAPTLLYEKHPFTLTACAIPVMWNVNAPSPPKSFDFLPRVLYYKGYERITLDTGVVCTWRWIDVTITNIPTSFMIDPDTVAPVDVNLLYNDDTTRNGLVRTYYNGDVAVISDRRVHKAYFKITGVDFRNLDLFKPIYLEHVNLQGWYYVNQVIDFTPNKNKTTIYELVKAFDTLPFDRPIVTEIPTIQGGTRQLSAIGGGTLTAGGKQSFESLVGFNGSGNVGIIRGGGTVLGNGNIQTESNQHIFGNYNFGNDSVWIVGIGESDGSRYNGLQLTPAGVFKVHGGTVRTIVNSTIQDVYATIEGNFETVHLLGNG
jgi:hypothetical protein